MNIEILTLFPEMVEPFFSSSIARRAVEKGLVNYSLINFRDFSTSSYKKVDDIPYGGGAGMVLSPETLYKALDSINAKGKMVIFPSPSGKVFQQKDALSLSKEKDLVFICGHYEGIDQRVIDEYVKREYTIGDYVLSSGESATVVLVDSIIRLIPGVISDESLLDESFSNGLLEYPQYTRPESYCTKKVPEVLCNGNHAQIEKWRRVMRLKKTLLNRPDLLRGISLDVTWRETLLEILKEEDL